MDLKEFLNYGISGKQLDNMVNKLMQAKMEELIAANQTQHTRQQVVTSLCDAIAEGWRTNALYGAIAVDCICNEGKPIEFNKDFLNYLCNMLTFAAQEYRPPRTQEFLDEVTILTGLFDNMLNRAMVVDMMNPPPLPPLFGVGIDPAMKGLLASISVKVESSAGGQAMSAPFIIPENAKTITVQVVQK